MGEKPAMGRAFQTENTAWAKALGLEGWVCVRQQQGPGFQTQGVRMGVVVGGVEKVDRGPATWLVVRNLPQEPLPSCVNSG